MFSFSKGVIVNLSVTVTAFSVNITFVNHVFRFITCKYIMKICTFSTLFLGLHAVLTYPVTACICCRSTLLFRMYMTASIAALVVLLVTQLFLVSIFVS